MLFWVLIFVMVAIVLVFSRNLITVDIHALRFALVSMILAHNILYTDDNDTGSRRYP